MNCIVTLKINDYYPKNESIPYENFVCLFTYGDFFGKIPLIKKSNNICKHEIEKISSDIKYNIRILEFNESSLIGISEMIIPFNKIKKINFPGTMIQEQKIKLIIDVNTKRKLFGKLINSGDIYLLICAEVFIPDNKNIICPLSDKNEINSMKKFNNSINNGKIKVRISNKKGNSNMDGTPRTIKKRKMIMEIKSNREMLQKDNSNDSIHLNKYGNTNLNFKNELNINNSMSNDMNKDERSSTGMFRNKIKYENNQIKVIDFRNMNDNLYNNRNNDINLTKEIKKSKISKKRSPKKKVTILELMEQKLQPLLSNTSGIINSRSNTYYNNGSNTKLKSDTKKNSNINNNKSGQKKITNSKKNNNNDTKGNNNAIKRINKKEENKNYNSNKIIKSGVNSPAVYILSPNHNISSPNTININKIKRNNSKGINKINKKSNKNNNNNLYNNYNELNIIDINKNNYNSLLIKSKRNSSQETINRNKNETNSYTAKENSDKDNYIIENNKKPKIDISVEMIQRKSANNANCKIMKDMIKKNNNSYYNTNNDVNSNGIISTEERTEQGLSEIDKIILEKGTELRDTFQNQFRMHNSNIFEINKNIYNNNQKIDKINYDSADNQLIGGANYTIETPKTNKEFECVNNTLDNKSSFCSSSQSLPSFFTQEDVKNNYIGLIDLYKLLNQKLSKTIFENNDLNKKYNIYKEYYNNEIKKEEIIKDQNDKYMFNSYINVNMKQLLNDKLLEQLIYIKNLESKLCQNIFSFSYDDYEIIRTKEIERVNKLNEERKVNILLKVIKSIINDCGNVSQIFYNNKKKEELLKNVLEKYNIVEKKEGEENYINLKSLNLTNDINYTYKYHKYHNYIDEDDIFENKVIREVDEDKEEEESVYSTSNKKKSNFHFYLNLDKDSQNIESIRQSLNNVNINQEILENNKDDNTENDEKENEKDEKTQKKENNKECTEDKSNKNDDIINNNEGEKENNTKIEIIKDILINKYSEKYGKNKKFIYINENKFLFDNKYNVIAELNLNNEVIIEIDDNKYNLEEFYSNYGKDEINEIKKEKEKFVYTKKIRFQQNKINNNNEINKVNKKEGETNEHQKKRRKRRIIDDDSEEENNKKEENNEKENLSSDKNV
jgi:hypothetical protein